MSNQPKGTKMTKITKPRGQQFRTKIAYKRYIGLLHKHGRSTVKQFNTRVGDNIETTQRRLRFLYKNGDINGALVGRTMEYWVE